MGNLVESGSNGMVIAVLFRVKKSVTCVNRLFAVEVPSDILTTILRGLPLGQQSRVCESHDRRQRHHAPHSRCHQ